VKLGLEFVSIGGGVVFAFHERFGVLMNMIAEKRLLASANLELKE